MKLIIRACAPAALLAAGAFFSPAWAQQGDGTDVEVQTHVFKPAVVPATSERMAALKVPAGFTVKPFATGLKNARMIAVADDGRIYVTRRDQGDVVLLEDKNGDGVADAPERVVLNRPGVHGLAIHDGKLYVATVKEIFVGALLPDGGVGPMKMLLGDLPDSGQHPNRTIAFGPDGMLYISVGSTCNDCNESNPENATLLQAKPDGSSRSIFASGLRNTIGYDWNPTTGELWGLDHGIDFLGDDKQQEELNLIRHGKKYGWPHVFGAGELYPQSTPVGGITKEQWRATSEPMVLGYTAHAAPMQLKFYSGGNFPADYQGDAFATMRGSWNRAKASGYELVRVHFIDGQAVSIEPFLTGFLVDGGRKHFARPVGLAVAKDGALLMSDDANGVIYRIAYDGTQGSSLPKTMPPATAMQSQTMMGVGVPIAIKRDETRANGAEMLKVVGKDVGNGKPIPKIHSDYYDGVSPMLSWTPVTGAMSYALIMEDPDAKPITPFVHWLAWNVPAEVTSLPEGLQEQPRLTAPEGLLQGRNSRGSPGYFGPKPPVGDPPHHYHFQLFALDAVLDVPAGSDRDTLIAAMQGHVLGRGELVGTYRQTIKPLK